MLSVIDYIGLRVSGARLILSSYIERRPNAIHRWEGVNLGENGNLPFEEP